MSNNNDYNAIKKSNSMSNKKNKIRNKGLIPFINNGVLHIYKVKPTFATYELINKYDEKFSDLEPVIFLNDNDYKVRLYQKENDPILKKMVYSRPSTIEELWNYYNLDEEANRKLFMDKFSKNIELDGLSSTRKESIEEILIRIKNDYVTCIIKQPSNLSNFLGLYYKKIYIEYMASFFEYFLYQKYNFYDLDFNNTLLENSLILTSFNKKEQSLSIKDKFNIIEEIYNTYQIECKYSCNIDEIDGNEINKQLGVTGKDFGIKYTKHITEVLESDFCSSLINKIINNKGKKKFISK